MTDSRSSTGALRGAGASTALILLAILAVAVGLRLWGVNWGLPLLLHNDEGNEVLRALRLGAGDFELQRVAKGGYFYLLFVEYGVLYLALRLFGIVGSPADFADFFVRDPTVFYLIGRTTTALIGAATVYLVYSLGRRAYSRAAGLWGAGLLAINVLHADLSHYIAVDVPMTFLAVATLYFAVRMVTEDRASNYAWAALFAALATTTKITAVLLLVPLLLAHFFHARAAGRPARFYFVGAPLLRAAAVFMITYVVTTPGIITHFGNVVSWTSGLFATTPDAGVAASAGTPGATTASDYESPNLYRFYANVLLQSMGLPAFILCLAGILYAFVRRTAVDLVLLSYAACVYLAMAGTSDESLYYPRYILPAIPVLAILSGRVTDDTLLRVRERYRSVATVMTVAALAFMPLPQIVDANVLMTREDTRATAKKWIEAHVPADAKIFIEGTRTRPIEGTVPLNNSPGNLKARIAAYRDREPGKARYFDIERRVRAGPTYDLLTVSAYDELRDLQYYKSSGVEYFVLRPDAYPQSRRRPHWPRLVAELRSDPETILLKRFSPVAGQTPGPLIEIYKVSSDKPEAASP